MTAVVQQTRLNWLLPASGFLAVVALLLVIAIGVSVGELSIPPAKACSMPLPIKLA
ncbi:Uncharacterised protein [Leclercia adecarboxylata]|uniref:Uncharacterized protein n=1 Tax=Leclercia adecarboxylata TaxID=83655 RepID=A0A4U9ILC7_9ENTR|nr:Uncharacterised protein [Leclercia adecarboxylata]